MEVQKLNRTDQELLETDSMGSGFQISLINDSEAPEHQVIKGDTRKNMLDSLMTASPACPVCAEKVLKMEGLSPLK